MPMNKQELFEEIEFHLMNDDKPSLYLNKISNTPSFHAYPFQFIYALKGVPQSPKYHPEGDAWEHTMLVIDEASKVKENSSDSKAFMWGALLHDIGKSKTTRIRKGRITSYDHDTVGAGLAELFFNEFELDPRFTQMVITLVRYHMHLLYVTKRLPYGDINGLKKQANINDIALLGWCDRMGRTNADPFLEQKNIELFYQML